MNTAKHLVLDVGNTRIKYGYFENQTLKSSGVCDDWTAAQWNAFHNSNPFSKILIGAAGPTSKRLLNKLPNSCHIQYIDTLTKYPFTTAYETVENLGVDRRAALSGALLTHPKTPVLIIDAGSCITYDYISAQGHHRGGAISPGRAMRYKAMHLFTEKLPLIIPQEPTSLLGTTTEGSMLAGVEMGVVAEIQAQIDAFLRVYGNFTIILTGGDADFLIKKIKNTIFADADLILKGLYNLLVFNSINEK